jgi:hypothetical protein
MIKWLALSVVDVQDVEVGDQQQQKCRGAFKQPIKEVH